MATTLASFFGREDSTLPDQPNGWVWDNAVTGASITIRQAYERYVLGATLPPEVQYQRYYDATAAIFQYEGYTEKEIKWWFLRTGQGPKCYRQYGVGGLCGLPPYDVWYSWYIKQQPAYEGGCFYVWADRRNNDCYLMGSQPLYPPPGYRMPGIPCNTAGNRFNVETDQSAALYAWLTGTGPWFMPDLPEMWGDPSSFAFSLELMLAWDAVGVIGAGFCSDLEVDESAGLLHPVPLAFTVFKKSHVDACARAMASGGACQYPIRGLPIGIMAYLDKLTDKQWPTFFEGKVREYMAHANLGNFTDAGIAARAWPLALADTLRHFNITDASLWSFQQKIDDVATKLSPKPRKRGATILVGGGEFGQIFFMVVVMFITWGVASAVGAIIAEAVAAAEAAAIAEAAAAAEAALAAGETVAVVEQTIALGEVIDTAKQVQTVYNVVNELQADNPNLLSIASGLLKISGSLDIFGSDVAGVAEYDYGYDVIEPVGVGGEQFAFDYSGDGLTALDPIEIADLTNTMTVDALNAAIPEYDFSGVDFAGEATGNMQAAVDTVVANLDQYAGDPNALYAAIEDAAAGVTDSNAEFALAVIDETVAADIETTLNDAMAVNADVAATTDVGPLTVDQLDMTALDEGWDTNETTGITYDEAASEGLAEQVMAVEAASEITIEDAQKLLDAGAKIAAVVAPIVIAPPSPPPREPAPAPIVAAPAPTQPLPGSVATVTYEPVYSIDAPALDPLMQIQTLTAGFGPIATDEPIAPDGKKGFNLWWLLPLGLLALPLNDKRRTHKRGRKRT
jgi:hypothetical protein